MSESNRGGRSFGRRRGGGRGGGGGHGGPRRRDAAALSSFLPIVSRLPDRVFAHVEGERSRSRRA